MSLYDFDPGKPSTKRPTKEQPAKRKARRTPKRSAASPNATRLKVTVQHPTLLDAMAEELGLSKSAVFNLALSRLAEEYDLK